MKHCTRCLLAALVVFLSASGAEGQAVNFTGFVDSDFAGLTRIVDPGGVDVAMPGSMSGLISGWDLAALALSFDEATDTLYVGLDTYGVLGDADGDNDAGGTSAALASLGGVDHPDLGGTETFIVVFDLDDDGTPDVIAGLPMGGSLSSFKVSEYAPGIPLSSAHMAFGNNLPTFTGTYLGTPIPQCPDIEFTIPNFCDLLNQYAGPGQDAIGVYVYLGSQDDATIGEDRLHGATVNDMKSLPFSDFVGCLPILNNYALEMVGPSIGPGWSLTTSYGVPAGFGCCLLVSTATNPGLYLPAPIDVTILVGTGPSDTIAIDLGLPPQTSDCMCKETNMILPLGIETLTFHSQIFSYRPQYDPNEAINFYGSNRLTIGPSSYPTTGN